MSVRGRRKRAKIAGVVRVVHAPKIPIWLDRCDARKIELSKSI